MSVAECIVRSGGASPSGVTADQRQSPPPSVCRTDTPLRSPPYSTSSLPTAVSVAPLRLDGAAPITRCLVSASMALTVNGEPRIGTSSPVAGSNMVACTCHLPGPGTEYDAWYTPLSASATCAMPSALPSAETTLTTNVSPPDDRFSFCVSIAWMRNGTLTLAVTVSSRPGPYAMQLRGAVLAKYAYFILLTVQPSPPMDTCTCSGIAPYSS
mmetsp:Transcript_21952/g.65650  ORF Transcript_21952/g.65650 Transcript_21952/m.65650 type:complete len:212 (-) Transcript_21952:1338-1973(-)